MQGTVVSGTLPVVVGMQGNNEVGVVGVVGVHGTVVELPGTVVVVPVGHGGSVVELVGAGVHGNVVGVSWPMDVDVPVGQGGSEVVGPVVAVPGSVVGVPGVVVVVVVMKVVVVVPGVGPAPQSNERNSDVRIAVAAGKPANAVCSDVMSWQTGWRMAGSSAVAVWETATAGCPSRRRAHRGQQRQPVPPGPGVGGAGGRRRDRPLDLGGRKQRAVLAALLLDAGRAVSVDRLIDALWGGANRSGAGSRCSRRPAATAAAGV